MGVAVNPQDVLLASACQARDCCFLLSVRMQNIRCREFQKRRLRNASAREDLESVFMTSRNAVIDSSRRARARLLLNERIEITRGRLLARLRAISISILFILEDYIYDAKARAAIVNDNVRLQISDRIGESAKAIDWNIFLYLYNVYASSNPLQK